MIQICRLTDLKNKEVISVCDGCRLGFISDVEIDISSGKIITIIVPGELKHFSFGRCDEMRISWERIEKIGPEVILVNIKPEECSMQRKCDQDDKRNNFKKKKKNVFGKL